MRIHSPSVVLFLLCMLIVFATGTSLHAKEGGDVLPSPIEGIVGPIAHAYSRSDLSEFRVWIVAGGAASPLSYTGRADVIVQEAVRGERCGFYADFDASLWTGSAFLNSTSTGVATSELGRTYYGFYGASTSGYTSIGVNLGSRALCNFGVETHAWLEEGHYFDFRSQQYWPTTANMPNLNAAPNHFGWSLLLVPIDFSLGDIVRLKLGFGWSSSLLWLYWEQMTSGLQYQDLGILDLAQFSCTFSFNANKAYIGLLCGMDTNPAEYWYPSFTSKLVWTTTTFGLSCAIGFRL